MTPQGMHSDVLDYPIPNPRSTGPSPGGQWDGRQIQQSPYTQTPQSGGGYPPMGPQSAGSYGNQSAGGYGNQSAGSYGRGQAPQQHYPPQQQYQNGQQHYQNGYAGYQT